MAIRLVIESNPAVAADPDKVNGISLLSNLCQSIERSNGVWTDPVWVSTEGIYEEEAVSE